MIELTFELHLTNRLFVILINRNSNFSFKMYFQIDIFFLDLYE